MIGAGQVGTLPPGVPAVTGTPMIVDPWGTILAQCTQTGPASCSPTWTWPGSTRSDRSYRCWHTAARRRTVGLTNTDERRAVGTDG